MTVSRGKNSSKPGRDLTCLAHNWLSVQSLGLNPHPAWLSFYSFPSFNVEILGSKVEVAVLVWAASSRSAAPIRHLVPTQLSYSTPFTSYRPFPSHSQGQRLDLTPYTSYSTGNQRLSVQTLQCYFKNSTQLIRRPICFKSIFFIHHRREMYTFLWEIVFKGKPCPEKLVGDTILGGSL